LMGLSTTTTPSTSSGTCSTLNGNGEYTGLHGDAATLGDTTKYLALPNYAHKKLKEIESLLKVSIPSLPRWFPLIDRNSTAIHSHRLSTYRSRSLRRIRNLKIPKSFTSRNVIPSS
jgi:hypothetical protein